MSGMVFCHGCGTQIHCTAPACPKCGAPQYPAQVIRPDYSFGGSVTLCFRRYAQFAGRAPRAEYWFFVLFMVLIEIGAVILDAALFDGDPVFYTIAILVFLLPGLAVAVRRLHDRDQSGWWVCLGLIPWLPDVFRLPARDYPGVAFPTNPPLSSGDDKREEAWATITPSPG